MTPLQVYDEHAVYDLRGVVAPSLGYIDAVELEELLAGYLDASTAI